MAFTQIITVKGADEQTLRSLIAEWDAEQAGSAPGYIRSRLFGDVEDDQHVLVVDFSSEDDAQRNNDRPETSAWAERLRTLADGEPSYLSLRHIYETDG